MFEIIKIKTFQNDEYRIHGDCKKVYLEWKHPRHEWELLYFCDLENDGIRSCVLHLAQEIRDLAFEHKMALRKDDFDFKAEIECRKIAHED